MDDKALIDALHYLGIDEQNCRVIALLPLVQVAWADGKVQPGESTTIMNIAKDGGYAQDDAARVLAGWLGNPPSEAYYERGRDVLIELARRGGGLDSGITPETIDQILVYCETVAKAAGGLFGLMFTVDAQEKRAIADIAAALKIAPSDPGWSDLVDDEAEA